MTPHLNDLVRLRERQAPAAATLAQRVLYHADEHLADARRQAPQVLVHLCAANNLNPLRGVYTKKVSPGHDDAHKRLAHALRQALLSSSTSAKAPPTKGLKQVCKVGSGVCNPLAADCCKTVHLTSRSWRLIYDCCTVQ